MQAISSYTTLLNLIGPRINYSSVSWDILVSFWSLLDGCAGYLTKRVLNLWIVLPLEIAWGVFENLWGLIFDPLG